jgi:photosystem II stability/assembly factor-like uncharacterized protein
MNTTARFDMLHHIPFLGEKAMIRTALILSVVLVGSVAASEPAWTEILKKGTNAIWCSRADGTLYASNGKLVMFTRDQGKTWEQAPDPQKLGRHWNSIGFDGDWTGGRVALFPVDSPIGRMTLDAGKTWATFPKPEKSANGTKKHDGWTFGAVDWSAEKPVRLFAKEHHTSNYWFSKDAGQTWTHLPSVMGYYGLGMGADGALLIGRTVGKKDVRPKGEGGIYRSEDDGQTWTLVFACELASKVRACRYNKTVYWPTKQGLAASKDGGKTWALMPDSPKDALFGPYLGETDAAMLVVSTEGVSKTVDGGKTWKLVMPKAALPKPVPDAKFAGLMPNFAWDWKNDILYTTSMGVPLFKCELGTE